MSKSTPKLKLRDNGIWYIQWTENRKPQKQSTGYSAEEEGEAQKALGRFLIERSQGPVDLDDGGASVTVGTAWQTYWDKHVREGGTAKGTVGSLNAIWNNMKPLLAHRRVVEVKGLMEEYVRLRRTGKLGTTKAVDGTIRKEVLSLIAALNFCCQPRHEVNLFNPDFIINMIKYAPDASEARDRWLKPWEVNALLAAAVAARKVKDKLSRVELFIWLALETAGRAEALMDLTRDRVDLDVGKYGVIRLDVPGKKKTSKRRANVPISKVLRPILIRALAEMEDQRPNATLLRNHWSIWPALNTVVIKAGINIEGCTDPLKATGVSAHVLRHTAASQMARRGVPLFKIAKILGNSVRMVEEVYGHFLVDDLQDAVDTVSDERTTLAEKPTNVVQLRAV